MRGHFLHADGLMDLCRMEVAAEEGVPIVHPQAFLIDPVHGHGGVEDVEGVFSRRDFGSGLDEEVRGIAPVPCCRDAVMEDEIP